MIIVHNFAQEPTSGPVAPLCDASLGAGWYKGGTDLKYDVPLFIWVFSSWFMLFACIFGLYHSRLVLRAWWIDHPKFSLIPWLLTCLLNNLLLKTIVGVSGKQGKLGVVASNYKTAVMNFGAY